MRNTDRLRYGTVEFQNSVNCTERLRYGAVAVRDSVNGAEQMQCGTITGRNSVKVRTACGAEYAALGNNYRCSL